MMFWHIGRYINEDMGYKQYLAYGSKILKGGKSSVLCLLCRNFASVMAKLLALRQKKKRVSLFCSRYFVILHSE